MQFNLHSNNAQVKMIGLSSPGSQYAIEPIYLAGARIITPTVFHDARGYFSEVFNLTLFSDTGIKVDFVQDCVSCSRQGVLRGFHGDFQTWKLVQVLKGAVMAAIVDLNPSSPTYFKSYVAMLNDINRKMLLVPPGFGNSFLVLSEEAIYFYKKTEYFSPSGEFTLRWNSPDVNVEWPISTPFLSKRDKYPPDTRKAFEESLRERQELPKNPFIL